MAAATRAADMPTLNSVLVFRSMVMLPILKLRLGDGQPAAKEGLDQDNHLESPGRMSLPFYQQ